MNQPMLGQKTLNLLKDNQNGSQNQFLLQKQKLFFLQFKTEGDSTTEKICSQGKSIIYLHKDPTCQTPFGKIMFVNSLSFQLGKGFFYHS